MGELLTTGARVNRVDEEGEVELFCYSLHRTFAFRVDVKEAARWGALLGRAITITIVDTDAALDDLYECVTCSAKPGCATLCRDCLTRRERAGKAWKGQRPAAPSSGDGGRDG